MPKRLAHSLASDDGVGVAVVRPDEFAAVAVSEVQRDDVRSEFENVERVPAEVVAGCRVEIDVAESRATPNAVPMMRSAGRPIVRASERRKAELGLAR